MIKLETRATGKHRFVIVNIDEIHHVLDQDAGAYVHAPTYDENHNPLQGWHVLHSQDQVWAMIGDARRRRFDIEQTPVPGQVTSNYVVAVETAPGQQPTRWHFQAASPEQAVMQARNYGEVKLGLRVNVLTVEWAIK